MPSNAVRFAPIKKFALVAGGLALVFILPLWRLVRFAAHDDLHSYILIIPVISAYLIWLERKQLPSVSAPAKKMAMLFFAGGLAAAAWSWCAPRPALTESLGQTTLSLLLLQVGAAFWILGGAWMRVLAFPFALLVFMLPLPEALHAAVEFVLQHGSAVAAGWMLAVSDIPVMQNGLMFRLPGVNLQVAPECSGIHSTIVLFITSLVAGKIFLRQPWRRAGLCLVVLPLALMRNGFRIFVLAELCVRIGPEMLDSVIHRHGGPVFFALSLIPFFLLLYWLKQGERRKRKTINQPL